MSETLIYRARRIITMNPSRPDATHVAVRDGRFLGAGSFDELKGWGTHRVDERFADKVLMPGLVEGHSHLMEGALWRYVYVGFHDRMDPHGIVWPGASSIEAVIERLTAAQRSIAQADTPLIAWGFDPIYFGERRCHRADLDRVSSTRPIVMMHASLHIANANSATLRLTDWLRTGIRHDGIPLDADGVPTGELKGPEAMTPIFQKVGIDRTAMTGDDRAVSDFGQLCVRRGVTTATDLASPLLDSVVDQLLACTGAPDYPVRLVSLLRFMGMSAEQCVSMASGFRSRSTDRLRLGAIKVVADGSIQGFSARMRWPGYYNGAPNGLWYTAPEAIRELYERALDAGLLVHTHTNGDEATEAALDSLETALRLHPVRDHRFTLQHCQLANAAQFRRMQALGFCVNLFANHHFYWGDQHYQMTVGPERATRMNACATAIATGVPFTIHSDAPVTPLGPLFTAWCAVNRLTASGRVLGEAERITVPQALRAITLGAAYTLKLDAEVGSIESGKHADLAVLEDDPLTAAPEALKDVRIWGTMQGGRVFQAGGDRTG